MTNNIKLPPLPERFNYTNSSAHWCYSRYTMVRDDLGAYVRAEDYDALRNASEALQAENKRLLDALRQITEWPYGGNLYGQEKIKRFAQAELHGESEVRAERMEKALKDIRSLSSINSAMNPSPLALTVLLGDIHHIADSVLTK